MEWRQLDDKSQQGIYITRSDDVDVYDIYCFDVKWFHLYNCKDVSEDYLRYLFEWMKKRIGEEGYLLDGKCEDIDVREELQLDIQEGLWDWRNEVKEYEGHG